MEHEYTDESILKSAERLLRERGNITGEWMVKIDPNLGKEEYSVEQENKILVISGGTASAVVYGFGRLIREPEFRGNSAPDKSFRAIYFATHFGNWYDNAPEDEIDRYIEDLALWGCNVIRAWFDRHHFRNIMEPAAQKKLKNLKHIFRKSASLGMKNFLPNLANEAYAESPEALRADWIGLKNGYKTPIIGGHYHVELCPSKPCAKPESRLNCIFMKKVRMDKDSSMGTPGRRSASAGWIKFNVFQCRDYGLQVLPINQIVTSTRNGARKLLERSFFCYPINWDEGLEKMIQHYNEHPADNTSQYPGVKEGLATLKSVDSFEQFIQYLLKAG